MAIQNVYSGDRIRLYLLWPLYFLGSQLKRFDSTFWQIFRAVRNWWSVLFIFFGFTKSAVIHYKNGVEVRATKKDLGRLISLAEFANLPESEREKLGIRISGGSATIKVGGRMLKLDLEVANPVAIELITNEHSMIDVKGRDVVDVGAYVDDTAIYYLLHGKARRVYAFEPFPYLYNTGVRNVRANGLEKGIRTFNAAVAGSGGNVSLDKEFTSFGLVKARARASGKGRVKVVSLDSVVKGLKIRHGALKVDCEGCEYDIFRHASSETLRSFDVIHVEYHYGYADIVERLRNEGFRVSYTRPVYNFRGFGSRAMLNGHVVAVRKK